MHENVGEAVLQATLALATRMGKAGNVASSSDGEDSDFDNFGPNNSSESLRCSLPYGSTLLQLPAFYLEVWKRVEERQFVPIAQMLESVPVLEGLPLCAPDNNHSFDFKSSRDRLLKGFEQTCLHLMHMMVHFAHAVNKEESDVKLETLLLQQFHVIVDTSHGFRGHRKVSSIPTTVDKGNTLFSKGGLAHAELQKRLINWDQVGFVEKETTKVVKEENKGFGTTIGETTSMEKAKVVIMKWPTFQGLAHRPALPEAPPRPCKPWTICPRFFTHICALVCVGGKHTRRVLL